MTGEEAARHVTKPGQFLVRFSVRMEGELVVTYMPQPGPRREYVVQAADTAEKQRTLVDFLGSQDRLFIEILQVCPHLTELATDTQKIQSSYHFSSFQFCPRPKIACCHFSSSNFVVLDSL